MKRGLDTARLQSKGTRTLRRRAILRCVQPKDGLQVSASRPETIQRELEATVSIARLDSRKTLSAA